MEMSADGSHWRTSRRFDFSVSTIVSAEIDPVNAARARENLVAAGLKDIVELRIGDARETLKSPDDAGRARFKSSQGD